MRANNYDVIVLGTGGVGSAAALHLAQRGVSVVGLDRFSGAHAHGSSHGHTRMIRKAYFEQSDYVPLLRRTYELWSQLERSRGEQLYHPVGLIEINPPGGSVVPGVRTAARQHDLPVEEISRRDFAQRYPGFVLPDDYEAIFEQDAGYLLVENCVTAHLQQAASLGVEFRDTPVGSWSANQTGVSVRTAHGELTADKLVITAGAWAATQLADLDLGLCVVRKHLYWFNADDSVYHAANGCPAFFYETPDGEFYGFPRIDEHGLKVGEHTGGAPISDPLDDDKSIEIDDLQRVQAFLTTYLPGISTTSREHVVCYYTLSPDRNFIVDRHPEYEHVVFAAGLSGHGFKFTPVLGEILADLALNGSTALPIEFLGYRP